MGEEGAGRLVVVATPIGNLDDLSPRAAAALRTADLVVAEDTRRTGRLLAHIGADTRQRALHEHNERVRIPEVVAAIAAGFVVAQVVDAGMPGVSDPGYELVAACHAAGVPVEVVPGPSAVLAAVVASGLPTDRFTFEGFLPRKGAARRRRLAELSHEPRTMVVFVSPHRLRADVEALLGVLGGDRPAALARELTKLHEEVRTGSLAALLAGLEESAPRGEFTLVIAGAPPPALPTPVELVGQVTEREAAGISRRDAIAEVAAATGVSRRELYQAVLDRGSTGSR